MAATDYLLPNLVTGTFPSCTVKPLIDGQEFNEALEQDLSEVASASTTEHPFVYVANWWLGLAAGKYKPAPKLKGNLFGPAVQDSPGYFLDAPTSATKSMLSLLKALPANGVDVRVMGWVSLAIDDQYIFNEGLSDHVATAAQTVNAITLLRKPPGIGKNAIMNVLGHPAGSVHLKMVVLGKDSHIVAYTGGIDFAPDRWAEKFPAQHGRYFWHDAMARVEGFAVQPIYECFRLTYNENLGTERRRMVHFEGKTLPSADTTDGSLKPIKAWADLGITVPPIGTQTVQSLRTVPSFKYTTTHWYAKVKTVSFADGGRYEIRDALKNAIDHATSYVYLEDQYFWSDEVFSWLRQAILQRGVKVILVISGASDPRDPQFSSTYLGEALAKGLFNGQAPTSQILNNVVMFSRWGEIVNVVDPFAITSVTAEGNDFRIVTTSKTVGPVPEDQMATNRVWLEVLVNGNKFEYPVIQNDALGPNEFVAFKVSVAAGFPNPVTAATADLKWGRPVVIHSKIRIVDDVWATIGSPNITRRSLYTEFEHAVAFIDPNPTGTSVRDMRARLWAEHFHSTNIAPFNNLAAALNGWNTTWGMAGGITLPTRSPVGLVPQFLDPVNLTTAAQARMSANDQKRYDNVDDIDARKEWGFFFKPG